MSEDGKGFGKVLPRNERFSMPLQCSIDCLEQLVPLVGDVDVEKDLQYGR